MKSGVGTPPGRRQLVASSFPLCVPSPLCGVLFPPHLPREKLPIRTPQRWEETQRGADGLHRANPRPLGMVNALRLVLRTQPRSAAAHSAPPGRRQLVASSFPLCDPSHLCGVLFPPHLPRESPPIRTPQRWEETQRETGGGTAPCKSGTAHHAQRAAAGAPHRAALRSSPQHAPGEATACCLIFPPLRSFPSLRCPVPSRLRRGNLPIRTPQRGEGSQSTAGGEPTRL